VQPVDDRDEAPAADAAAHTRALHAHYRRLRFGDGQSARELEHSMWWRTDPLYRGLRAVADNGPSHSRKLRQVVQVPVFAAEFRVDPGAYYQYHLYDHWPDRARYIFHDEIVLLLGALNSRLSPQDTSDLFDKRAFAARCAKASLPLIPIVAEFEHGDVRALPAEEPRCDLFSKFADRYCGEGASSWHYRAGRYEGAAASLAFDELVARLAADSRAYPVILQPRMSNHPDLVPISGRGLSTARVITMRWPNGDPDIMLASYRMPVGSLVADNFAAGGLACAVDLETGVLGAARHKTGDGAAVSRHPDSGAPIEGRTLPMWDEVRALALAGHRCFASMASVGWDVAITPQGPLLVEGNPVWCVDLAQMSHGRPLGETGIPARLAAHFDAIADPAPRRVRRGGR
jgi:hypothetical protein